MSAVSAVLKFSPEQLHDVVCGSVSSEDAVAASEFKFREHFHVIMDDEFASFPDLEKAFWDTVQELSPAHKVMWLKFITGSAHLPGAHEEFIRIELPFMPITEEDYENNLQTLPRVRRSGYAWGGGGRITGQGPRIDVEMLTGLFNSSCRVPIVG